MPVPEEIDGNKIRNELARKGADCPARAFLIGPQKIIIIQDNAVSAEEAAGRLLLEESTNGITFQILFVATVQRQKFEQAYQLNKKNLALKNSLKNEQRVHKRPFRLKCMELNQETHKKPKLKQLRWIDKA